MNTPYYTLIGGYPILYLTCNDDTLCGGCAKDNLGEIVKSYCHWRGPSIYCEGCGYEIESASRRNLRRGDEMRDLNQLLNIIESLEFAEFPENEDYVDTGYLIDTIYLQNEALSKLKEFAKDLRSETKTNKGETK